MLGLALKFKVTGATILLIVTSVLYLAAHSHVFAAAGINQTINFQGKVVNSDGTNVADGNYDFTFRLYKLSSGGVAQWTENWTGGNQAEVTDGIFRVALGTHQSLSSLDFNDDSWYLSIEFNGDGEMDPRIRFASVPYAFNAKTVGGLTVTNTTGTLTIPNSTTISFAGAFTTAGANALTLTTTGSTNVTLPTTGTLATLAGNENLTNKTIGSTGLTFSGASLDVTTATDEDLTITPNGAGNAVFNLATTGDFLIQDASTSFVQFLDDGTITLGKGSGAGTINIGTGTAADVLNFGSDNTAGDTIVIGNSNASTTLALTGGDDWSISTAGNLTLAGTTGITLSGAGADVNFANLESLSNDTNGTITFGRNDAGTVTLNARDDDTTAALSIFSGGASAVTLDTGGAAVLNLGNANATSIAFGNSSVTAVDLVGGAATINVFDNAATKTIDIGGVTNSGTDTISIATNATAADIITIGNSNASTTLALTGGDDWSISTTGNAIFAGTTGVSLTGTGADLIFANLERITNDSNGAFTFARNDAGTVTLSAADDDATAALSILSGGAAAITIDTGGTAALNLGNTNATSITLGNSSTTAFDLIAGTATVNIADNATTKTIDIGGVTNSGTDTINIATNASAGDTISIGNTHASTALVLTGGDDWLITATGSAHMNAWEGGGLYQDCNAADSKLLWDSDTKQFSCSTDLGNYIQTATFSDSNSDTLNDTNQDLWDGTKPNITPTNVSSKIVVYINVRVVGAAADDENNVFELRRSTSGAATCASTAVGTTFGTFSTQTSSVQNATLSILDTPGVTSNVSYTVCENTASAAVTSVNNTTPNIDFIVTEYGAGGSAASNWDLNTSTGTINPKITTVDALFGGSTTSSAKIAFIGMNSTNTPIASVSATSGANAGRGVTVSGDGSIQTLNRGTMTVGGSTTGDIILAPRGSVAGASVAPGADDTVDLGASSSARFRNLFLGPDSLHLQCLTADGCGQNLDYSISVNTTTNALYISNNGRTGALNQLLTINEGGRIDVAGNLQIAGTTGLTFTSTGGINLAGGTLSDSSDGVDIADDLDITGNISLTGGTISDATDGVDINDDLDVSGGINITGSSNIAFTSSGGITLTGGTISDATDEVDINDDLAIAGTAGLTFTGAGSDITFTNLEQLSNDTNGTITFGRNDAGTVILNARDDDATAALTINSGGAAALTIDTGGGATLSLGNANANAIVIGNETGSTSVEIDSGSGAINIGNAIAKTITIGNSASTTSITLSKGASGNFVLQSGGAALDCSGNLNSGALSTNSSGQIICTDDEGGSGGATAWNAIGDASVNGAIALAQTTQTMDWIMSSDAALDGLTFTLNNGIGTDTTTQRLIVIKNANDGGSTGVTEALLVLDNADANEAVTAGLVITSSGGAATSITRGLDFDDSDIVTDIEFQNNETLANDTDDEITFTGAGGSNNAGLIIDLDGASAAIPTLRAAANDLINIFDGLSIGIDGATTENISLTSFAISGGNDLYVDDQFGVNGNVYIDGTIDTVGGLTFNGTVTDIATATDEDLTLTPNGTGGIILSSDFNSGVKIGSSTNTQAVLSVSGGIGLNAALVVNQTANSLSDIFAASSSGTTKFVIKNDGTASTAAGFITDGAGSIGSTKKQTFTVGGTDTGNIVIDSGSGVVTMSDYTSCDILSTSSTGQLTCMANGPDVVYASDTNTVSFVDNNTTDLWTGTAEPSITVANGSEVLVLVSIRVNADPGAAETNPVARVDREGAASDCADTNTVGPTFGTTISHSAAGDPAMIAYMGTSFVDAPSSGANQYALCSSADIGVIAGTTQKIRADMTLYELNDSADLAEVYPTNDMTLKAGEVVSMDLSMKEGVKRSSGAYDKNAIGVVSTRPALVIGGRSGEGTSGQPIALSGRVPVKVTTSNGVIKQGDMLTSSSIPGVAMKATKSGQIIGQAMGEYTGSDVGEVLMFVRPSQSTGSTLDELRATYAMPENVDSRHVRADLLSRMALHSEEAPPVTLSEISTDRLIAGLEVITPHVSTNTISLDKIESLTSNDVALILSENGEFAIKSEDGTPGITFDSNGNAFFAGTITAGKVRADQIEGIEILAGSISSLEDNLTSLSDMMSSGGAVLGESTLSQETLDSLTLSGGLVVGQNATFKGESVFEKLATFVSEVVFKDKVKFEKTPEFNKDTVGFAVIKKGDKRVHIEFDKSYYYTPVITATIAINEELKPDGTRVDKEAQERAIFENNYRILISNRSAKGFDIVLNREAVDDLPVSWNAFASFNASTFQTQGVAGFSATPTPQETSLITPQNSGAVSPENTPDPDESLSQAPAQSGQSSVSSEPTGVPNEANTTSTGSGVEEGGENL